MSALQAAIAAMRTSQTALQTIGNNLANVNTPGYHRQLVELADRRPLIIDGLAVGQGVTIAQIRQLRDASLESVLLQTAAQTGEQTVKADILRQIESLLTPGEGTLHAHVQTFFNQWELLAAEPGETVRRQEVLQSAVQITNEINSLAEALDSLKLGLVTEIESTVAEVNTLSQEIAALNLEIQMTKSRGITPNDLLDQRDLLVTRLSELIDAEVERAGAVDGVRLANGESFITTRAKNVSVRVDDFEGVQIFVEGFNEPVQLTSGRLAGLVEGYNSLIQGVEDQLAEFTSKLIHSVNSIHASGLGAGGGITHFKSTRPVIPTDVPLVMANAEFPTVDGDLYVGITDESTGIRTLHRLPINPSADSLEDIAAALNGLPGITSSADPATGQLRIDAESAYSFDFTGALPSNVVIDAATGTSVPALSGQYVGSSNDEWTLTVVGSGEVGVDSDIVLEVRNRDGVLLDSVPVGVGYAPGERLSLPDGVVLRVPAGTLNAGDTFRIPLSVDSDTAGVLFTIGAYDLFTGSRPGAVKVNAAILKDPYRLSVSQIGKPGDNLIATKLAALGRKQVLSGRTATFTEYLSLVSADSGLQVAQANRELVGLRQLSDVYIEQRQELSGVNPDEELIRMLEFQRMFEAAAQLLTTFNDTMDTLFDILR